MKKTNKKVKKYDLYDFKAGYYKITKIIKSNELEINDTWFLKLRGIHDYNPEEELRKWLKKDQVIRVIPHYRDNCARIISDVWLGNTYINKQFKKYKKEV